MTRFFLVWFLVSAFSAFMLSRRLRARREAWRRWRLARWQDVARELERVDRERQMEAFLHEIARAPEPRDVTVIRFSDLTEAPRIYRPPDEWVGGLAFWSKFHRRPGAA